MGAHPLSPPEPEIRTRAREGGEGGGEGIYHVEGVEESSASCKRRLHPRQQHCPEHGPGLYTEERALIYAIHSARASQ